MSTTARPYTAADDAVIRERAGNTSWTKLGAMLGRSADGVKNRAVLLGLANTGAGETAAFEAAMRQNDLRFADRFREVASKRGWAVHRYGEGAGA